MKIAGITAEYNPFHKGHLFHIERTRAVIAEDTAIVCVMSGNFTQRGEPALFNKHARAKAAVLCGADLVIELPLPFVLSSAESFCFGAVSLLDMLGCVDYLSFGSESGDLNALSGIAELLVSPEMDDLIKQELKHGVSYAAARQNAAETLSGRTLNELENPNNILGIEYLKALKALNSTIKPLTFKRIGAGHDDKEIKSGYVSASYIREGLSGGGEVWEYIPEKAGEVLKNEITCGFAPVLTVNLETAILSKLRRMTAEQYEALPDAAEGLGLRLMKYARSEAGIDGVLSKTKTKRYAMSRVRRMIMCAFLEINASSKPERPPYARVLAFNARGRKVLNSIHEAVPVITKPAGAKKLVQASVSLFELEAQATDLYSLAYPGKQNRIGGLEWSVSPMNL